MPNDIMPEWMRGHNKKKKIARRGRYTVNYINLGKQSGDPFEITILLIYVDSLEIAERIGLRNANFENDPEGEEVEVEVEGEGVQQTTTMEEIMVMEGIMEDHKEVQLGEGVVILKLAHI